MNTYFLYCFSKYAWIDRVFTASFEEKTKQWDLIKIWLDYYLNLWESLSFKENYKYWLNITNQGIEIVYKKFFTKKTVELIHYIVWQYYTTYRKVIPLFVDKDIDKVLRKEISKSVKPRFHNIDIEYLDNQFVMNDDLCDGQELIVFPMDNFFYSLTVYFVVLEFPVLPTFKHFFYTSLCCG